jgi:hypothetical protein
MVITLSMVGILLSISRDRVAVDEDEEESHTPNSPVAPGHIHPLRR